MTDVRSSDDEFIPYFVLVQFDRGADLRDRLEESLPLLQAALAELGKVQPVASSYDGSMVTYMLAARPQLQPGHIEAQLQSPRSRQASPLKTNDRVVIVSVGVARASRIERLTAWLGEYGLLA